MPWALTRLSWKKGHQHPPTPPSPLLLALVSSPSSLLTIGKPAALPGRATGSPQPACGLQTFFGRAGVAAERPALVGPLRLHCRLGPPPCLPTSLPFLYCAAMFDRHRAYNNLFPAGTCTICLADPTNSFNPLSPCLVFTAVAHRRGLINAASLFIFTSCSLFDPLPPPPPPPLTPRLKTHCLCWLSIPHLSGRGIKKVSFRWIISSLHIHCFTLPTFKILRNVLKETRICFKVSKKD